MGLYPISTWIKVDHHLVEKIDGKLIDSSLEAQKRCVFELGEI